MVVTLTTVMTSVGLRVVRVKLRVVVNPQLVVVVVKR